MSKTIKTLLEFVVLSIEDGQFESAMDKNGNPFARVQPVCGTLRRVVEVDSASVYVRKNNCVKVLANIRGYNHKTQKPWARSASILVKPVNETTSIVIEGRRPKFALDRAEFDSLIERLS